MKNNEEILDSGQVLGITEDFFLLEKDGEVLVLARADGNLLIPVGKVPHEETTWFPRHVRADNQRFIHDTRQVVAMGNFVFGTKRLRSAQEEFETLGQGEKYAIIEEYVLMTSSTSE